MITGHPNERYRYAGDQLYVRFAEAAKMIKGLLKLSE